MRKKMLLFAGVTAISSSIAAQVQIGIHTGGNMSNAVYTATGNGTYKSKQLIGFHAGISADLALTPEIHAFLPLQFIQKGSKFTLEQTIAQPPLGKIATNVDITQPLNCIQLPLNITYQFDLGKLAKFFIGAGPSFSYAFGGNTKRKGTIVTTVTVLGISTTSTSAIDDDRTLKIGSTDKDDLKPFELGANAVAGLKLNNGFALTANYTYGFSNQAPQTNTSYKARSFGATLHYFLNAEKD